MLEIVLHWFSALLIEAVIAQSNPELTNIASHTNKLWIARSLVSAGNGIRSWNDRKATILF